LLTPPAVKTATQNSAHVGVEGAQVATARCRGLWSEVDIMNVFAYQPGLDRGCRNQHAAWRLLRHLVRAS
jgi:hypothetical protein